MKKANEDFEDLFLEALDQVEEEMNDGLFAPPSLDDETLKEEEDGGTPAEHETPFIDWLAAGRGGASRNQELRPETTDAVVQMTKDLMRQPENKSLERMIEDAVRKALKEDAYDSNGRKVDAEADTSVLDALNDLDGDKWSYQNLAYTLAETDGGSDTERRYKFLISALSTARRDKEVELFRDRVNRILSVAQEENLLKWIPKEDIDSGS